MDQQALTIELLKTVAGQVLAVGTAVQLLKQMIPSAVRPGVADGIKQGMTLALAVALNLVFVGGTGVQTVVLNILNGLAVAAASMKAYEVVVQPATDKALKLLGR